MFFKKPSHQMEETKTELWLPKNLFYFHDIINILIVTYSFDYTAFNFFLLA